MRSVHFNILYKVSTLQHSAWDQYTSTYCIKSVHFNIIYEISTLQIMYEILYVNFIILYEICTLQHTAWEQYTSISSNGHRKCTCSYVVVLVFEVPSTDKVIWRRGHGLKSHPTDWKSLESNLRPLVYKGSDLSTTPQQPLTCPYACTLSSFWFANAISINFWFAASSVVLFHC